jgi:hypothetical protein
MHEADVDESTLKELGFIAAIRGPGCSRDLALMAVSGVSGTAQLFQHSFAEAQRAPWQASSGGTGTRVIRGKVTKVTQCLRGCRR